MELVFTAVFFMAALGVVGLLLGFSVGKPFPGFLLGAFLGPIGWIIVFLLPRDVVETAATRPLSEVSGVAEKQPDPDLANDAYRIWLAKKYQIKKNDLFEKYECKEQLFETLQDALLFAHEQEENERPSEDSDASKDSPLPENLRLQGASEQENKGYSIFLWALIIAFFLVPVLLAIGAVVEIANL